MNTAFISNIASLPLTAACELILLLSVIYTVCGFVAPVFYTIHHYYNDTPPQYTAWLRAFITGDLTAFVLSALFCRILYHVIVLDPFTLAVLMFIQLIVSIFIPLVDKFESTNEAH